MFMSNKIAKQLSGCVYLVLCLRIANPSTVFNDLFSIRSNPNKLGYVSEG